jgi:hypothetical protein
MTVICLKRTIHLGSLGVVVIYFPHKDEKSTAFDIRHHINEKKKIRKKDRGKNKG